MSVVYLTEQNAMVSKEGNRLLVKKEKTILHTLHTFKMEQVIVFGNVFLTPSAIKHLLAMGVDTAFMTRNGRYLGRLQPPMGKNIVLRREQFRRADDPDFCLRTAKAVVKGKLNNLRTVIMRLNRTREDVDLSNHIVGIRSLVDRIDEAPSPESVQGYEGKGSAVYFDGFSKGILSNELEFKQRVRRPPTDPINALLSLGYTLLFNTVLSAVGLAGFDPYLGFLHTTEYGRPSLALDLMEEWRSIIIDTLVLSVINLKVLTREDFEFHAYDEDAELEEGLSESSEESTHPIQEEKEIKLPVKLTDAGFRKFITQFERKMSQKVQYHLKDQNLNYRDCIREQVYHFARYIRGEDESYTSMPLR
jgi:CRISPR-associated protein Cas1